MKPKTGKKPVIPIADMSVDDFLDNMDFDADSDDNEVDDHIARMAKGKSNKKLKTGKNSKSKVKSESSQDDEEPELSTVPKQKSVTKKTGKKSKSKAKSDSSQDDEEPELPTVSKQKATTKKMKKVKPKASDDSSEDEETFELPPKMKAKLDKALKKAAQRAKKFEATSDSDEGASQKTVKSKKEKKKKGDKTKLAPDTENGIEEKAAKDKKKKAKRAEEVQEESGESGDDTHDHNEALNNLKETDPEFYKFLENNDRKLLNFSITDKSDEDSDEDDVKNEKVHKPDGDLQVASDESDFEADDDVAGDEEAGDDDDEVDEAGAGPSQAGGKQIKITLKMLKEWERDLQLEDVTAGTIKTITVAFRSALQSISSEDITEKQAAIYRVEGAAVFNGIVQLCVLHLPQALLKFLKVDSLKMAKQSKRFKKIIGPMRSYLPDITKLLENATSTSILMVLLKHLHQLAPLMPFIFNLTKPILKRLITLWATAEDSVRVLSFLCILKITRAQQPKFLKDVLRIMYLNYVKNCKFVSPNTLPSINFMRRSLAEMFCLEMNASYNIVFMFVRQLAIHLRNAYTDRKKENSMAVYNWQYINSLRLWGDVLAQTHSKQQLQPLIYPFVTIVIGVIKLIPSAQYYPARFHCCRILVMVAKRTNTFIPVLPFLLEVLKGSKFNAKHKKVSMKPLKFTCLLRLQQSQIDENAWKDEVVDQVHAQVLEYMAHESCALAFPELALFSIINLRDFLKECQNSKHHRELKLLLDKIIQNSEFIEQKRKTINFALKDIQQINAWETNIRNKGTPLNTMFQTWSKKNESKKRREASDADNLNEYSLPPLPKPKVVKRQRDSGSDTDENEGPTELFPSSESDSELEVEKPIKKTQAQGKKAKNSLPKKVKKTTSAPVDDDAVENSIVDIVNDLNIADWD